MIVFPILVIEGRQSRKRSFSEVRVEPGIDTPPADRVVLERGICVREEAVVGKDESNRCRKRGMTKGVYRRIERAIRTPKGE